VRNEVAFQRLQKEAERGCFAIHEHFLHASLRVSGVEKNLLEDYDNPALSFSVGDKKIPLTGVVDRIDEDDQFFRIVDYKTGSKTFSLEDVRHGINIQMLLYLFTLCHNSDTQFCQALGVEKGKTPTPAGIMYLSANIPVIQAEDFVSEEEVLKQAADQLKRSGLLINEEEILRAMNAELSPKFLAGIKRNKDGILVGAALTDREAFGELYDQIQSVIQKITLELRGGVADANPMNYQKIDPCAYCDMKPICRRADH
jgi:ATP-dependent helicase/nuclease subunit B